MYLVPVPNRFGQLQVIPEADRNNKAKWDNTNSMIDQETKDLVKAELAEREWSQPFNRYDNIFISNSSTT